MPSLDPNWHLSAELPSRPSAQREREAQSPQHQEPTQAPLWQCRRAPDTHSKRQRGRAGGCSLLSVWHGLLCGASLRADTEPHPALYVAELQGQGQRLKPGLS